MELEKLSNARVGAELEMPDFLAGTTDSFALDDSLSLGSTGDADPSGDGGRLTDDDAGPPPGVATPSALVPPPTACPPGSPWPLPHLRR